MQTKALIFDLDSTLTESKSSLSPEMGTLLSRLLLNMPVAIMSGGSWEQFQKQLLGGMPPFANYSNLYLFPTGGAQCYKWEKSAWKFIYNNPFTDEERVQILTALGEALKETGLDEAPEQLWGEQTEDRGSQITWSALGQHAPIEAKRVWDPERAKRLPLQQAILARLNGFSVRMNATTSIDITREGITKAYGVRQLSDILKIPIEAMLYVGDALFPGGNDEIVKETGVPTQQVYGPRDTAKIIEGFLLTA